MSYTFRVIFDGVCAFVPDKPFFSRNKDTGVWGANGDKATYVDVLLPDLTRAEYNTQAARGLRIFRSPHIALLKFQRDHLDWSETSRRVDLVCRDIDSSDEEGLLFLKREQIRFHLKASNVKCFEYADWSPDEKQQGDLREAVIDSRISGVHVPTTDDQMESLWWLPRLREIEPHYDRVNSRMVRGKDGLCRAFPEELQARVEINGGRLRTFGFNRDVNGEPQPWRFLPADETAGSGVWNRAIGNRLALEFFDVCGRVGIELKRIANDVEITNLVLMPRVDQEVLEVVMTNSEPEALFGVRDRLTAQLPDPDFEEFYYMLTDPDSNDFNELRPVPNPSGFGFIGILDKPCSPAEISR